MCIGTLNACEFDYQEIAKKALDLNSTFIVTSKNHTMSSQVMPSPNDVIATFRLRQVLASIGVSLYDHIIVSDSDAYSFREERNLNW